jgi:hypothetical protein
MQRPIDHRFPNDLEIAQQTGTLDTVSIVHWLDKSIG